MSNNTNNAQISWQFLSDKRVPDNKYTLYIFQFAWTLYLLT